MSSGNFGRYVIKGEIGRGGMATVYHAYDPLFERDVAIKVLPREFLHDPQFRTRFEREAKTVALLEHPAIVPVYDFGEEDGQPYIVMRYMSGGSLADRIEKGAIPLDEVARIINRLALALDAAHSKGIIHRDLKPGNILYDQYDLPFLSDFGIARLIQATPTTLTGGAILGTPAYMSPEQVQGGDHIDGRSDIYSLGVIVYQMLTGKTPYQSESFASLMMMHILEPVPHIREVKHDLPDELDKVIAKALAKLPADRYQTVRTLGDALTAVVTAASSGASVPRAAAPQTGTLVFEPDVLDEVEGQVPSRPPTLPPPSPPPTGPEAPPASTRSGLRSLPLFLQIISMLLIVGIGVISVVAYLDARRSSHQSALETYEVAAALASATHTPQPSEPATRTPLPSLTPEPSPTSTIPPPTSVPTETATAVPQVLGGADMIAFIREQDIWVVRLDGSDLTQLTTDGGTKTELQWTPDGQALVYISGLCVKMVHLPDGRVEDIACFEYAGTQIDEFELSFDATRVAISINKELYLVPFDLEILKEVDRPSKVKAISDCPAMAPYASSTGSAYAVSSVRWAQDGLSLAILQKIIWSEKQEDAIRLVDISFCDEKPYFLDEFPASRFRTEQITQLENFGWDGFFNFAMVKIIRNEGYGDMYFYNSDLHKPDTNRNPIEGSCCYRDPSYSPDGSYLAFAFEDLRKGDGNTIELYYIPVGTLFTGISYTPIPLPEGFFTDPKESPNPVARPVIAAP